MIMDIEGLFQEHKILHSGSSLVMGKIHWHILKAYASSRGDQRKHLKVVKRGDTSLTFIAQGNHLQNLVKKHMGKRFIGGYTNKKPILKILS